MNTGDRSLNRRIHGAFRAIAEQAKEKSYTPADAKHDLKWLSTAEGYPIKTRKIKHNKKVVTWQEPESLAGQSTQTAMILWMTIEVFASERNLYLYEYYERFPNDPEAYPYRSVGGRSLKEMDEYCDYLEKCGDVVGAKKLRQKPRWYKPGEQEPVEQEFDIF